VSKNYTHLALPAGAVESAVQILPEADRIVAGLIGQPTPKEQIFRRKGRGGKQFDYVKGHYVTKLLNELFGLNWDFEILGETVIGDPPRHIVAKCRLVVRFPSGMAVVKTQFGGAEIKLLTSGEGEVDVGNDFKAAATDGLKKCASMLGICSDIFSDEESKKEAPNRMPTDEEFKTFMSIGSKIYGDRWEEKRHELVDAVSDGATTSSKDLTYAELKILLDGFNEMLKTTGEE